MRNLISRFSLALVALGLIPVVAQAQPYSLTTYATYAGRQTGEVWVTASPFQTPLITTYKTRLIEPVNAAFTNAPAVITNLVGTYWLFAWRDSIANGVPDATEAQGWHLDNPFVVTNNLTVTGFVLADPDNNSNGLPDWWEVKYGLTNRMGSGRSGSLLIHPGQTNFIDSVWASVLGSNPAGTTTLNVSRTNGFASNDLVMIITMQDTNHNLGLNQSGTFEFGRIASMTQGGGITNLLLTAPHTNNFTPGTSQRIQVLKVPEYTHVNMTGSALKFYGTNTVRVPNFGWAMPTNEVTIEFWLRIVTNKYEWPTLFTTWPSDNANRVALGIGQSYAGGNLMWDFGNGWGSGRLNYNSGLTVGTWHHVAVTASQSANSMQVITNGVLERSAPHFDPFERGDYALEFGLSFVGELAEVRMWSKARSEAEIKADMYRALSGNEPGLVAYYRFDEGSGTNVLDATGHGHDGGWINAPAWVAPSTLTCQPWNGTNGGVLAFVAHQVTLGNNSVINADGKGYRGGPDYNDNDNDGYPGESFTGAWPVHSVTNNFGGGGGGGRSGYASGNSGAGGAYGTSGQPGTITPGNESYNDRTTTLIPAFRGTSYGTNTINRVLMGSGGGSGGQDANDSGDGNFNGGVGGAGGGILICSAGLIQNDGLIGSSGQNGSSQVASERGTGGGGAGGTVWITANWQSPSGVVLAQGGTGGQIAGYVGGDGGVGRIRLDLPPCAMAPILDPPAGYVQHLSADSVLWSPYNDTDQDGLSDLLEYQLDTNPVNPDTDGDTLPDSWEVAYAWPTNTLNPSAFNGSMIDSDQDGVLDLIEFQRGTPAILTVTRVSNDKD